MKSESWYKRIAAAVQEIKTFDLATDDKGCGTISQMIAFHMLSELYELDRHRLLDEYIEGVKNNLYHAIDYLNSCGVIVYRFIQEKENGLSGKNISCITIDPEYKDAYENNYKRIETNAKRHVVSCIKQAELTAPEKVNGLKLGTQKALLETS